MPKLESNQIPKLESHQKLEKVVGTASSLEFTTIFGSNVNPAWFTALMNSSANYLFSAALGLFLIKFFISVYQFYKAPTINIYNLSSLAWSIVETVLVGTALFGTLLAAAVFVVITPALFVVTTVADTFRNLGLLLWNTYKYFSIQIPTDDKQILKDDKYNIERKKAEQEEYLALIKQHSIGFVVSLAMATAAAIIFLFPHVGLAFIGATTVTAIGMSVAQIAGTVAGCVLGLSVMPIFVQGLKWAWSKLKNTFRSANDNPGIVDSAGYKLNTVNKDTLQKEIQDKLIALKKEPLTDKREAKISKLEEMRDHLERNTRPMITHPLVHYQRPSSHVAHPATGERIYAKIETNKYVRESFFKKKGDVQTLVDKCNAYFDQNPLLQ